MALKRKPYWYDAQLKRLLVQVMSVFSGYQVQTGLQGDGKTRFLDVPLIYGDMSRAAGYILNGGSENTMAYLPIMAMYMTRLTQKPEWKLAPQHSEKYRFIERARDPDGNLLINQPGKKKVIERYMPIPHDLSVDLSIWASNNDQGYQLVEQILQVFGEPMDIQLSNSPADWTFLTHLIFQGDVRMEKATPSGADIDPLYVFTMTFDSVIWLSPPAMVYEMKPIYEIHVPIMEIEDELDFDSMDELDGLVIKADDDDIIKFESFK